MVTGVITSVTADRNHVSEELLRKTKEANADKSPLASWHHGGFSGNGTWVISWDPVNKRIVNTPHLNSLGDMIVSTATNAADWIGDRFGDTQATRAIDYGVRLAALKTGYHAATQVLNIAKETADGSLVAAEATARTALQAAEGFLDSVVRNASQAVLKGPAEATKTIREGAKQGAVAVPK